MSQLPHPQQTPVSLEQCLLGDVSSVSPSFQQQLHQQNYIDWFHPQEQLQLQLPPPAAAAAAVAVSAAATTTHNSESNDNYCHISGKNLEYDDSNNNNTVNVVGVVDVDHENDIRTTEINNTNHEIDTTTTTTTDSSGSTSSGTIIDDVAPVSSKWSDCAAVIIESSSSSLPSSAETHKETQQQQQQQHHIIDLILLRKLVAAGYGMDDDDDDDNDDDDAATFENSENSNYSSHQTHDIPSTSASTSIAHPTLTTKMTTAATSFTTKTNGYRAISWRVLLGFLPLDTNQWLMVMKHNTNHQMINNEEKEDTADSDDDIIEVQSKTAATTSNNLMTIVQQRRELYISLVQELFQTTTDVTTIRAAELCSHHYHHHRRRAQRRHNNNNNRSTSSTTDFNSGADISRSSSYNTTGSMDNDAAVAAATSTANTDYISATNNATATDEMTTTGSNMISPLLQQYWKEKSLDPYILERCVGSNTATSTITSSYTMTNLNVLRVRQDDYYWNNLENKNSSDSINETANNNDEGEEDATAIIKQDNLQDFVDNVLLLDEIRKDVIRTHPDLAFFLDPYVGVRRYAALERILFVWSKYNKGVRYVQGMNEIVGILYYVLANDQNEEWSIWAEADTYWLFNTLIGDMRDVFISNFDSHDTGIHGRLITMQQLLQRHDPEIIEHFTELGIEISYYAIRWWTTLLCREFLLPDTIRLWDSLFASTHKDNFLRYVCVIMVMSIRDRLLKGDFTVCLQLLQDFPSTSIDQLVDASRALWIYESQISVACHRGGLSLHQALTTIESPPALIMAFGFVNGTPPPTAASILKNPIVDDIKVATVQIEATVRRSANELLGRAKGWYNRYNTSNNENKNQDISLSPNFAKENEPEDPILETMNDDDIYMKAFLEA